MRHSQHPRRGTVAVLTAVCLIGILGFAALSLDPDHAQGRQDRDRAPAGALAVTHRTSSIGHRHDRRA